jgi:hypothetical protein
LESFAKDKQLKQENYKKAVLHVEWGTSLTKAALEKNVNRKILKKVQISNKLNAEMEVNNLLDLENEKSPKQVRNIVS